MVVHLLCALLTGFYIYLSPPGTDLFSWHPVCMAVAFSLLSLQAILIFSPLSSLTPSSPRADKVQLHWIFQSFSLLALLAGASAVYLNKEIHGKKHFTTWHGRFGLATFAGFLLAFLGGVLANYSVRFRNLVKPIKLKMYHATLGMLVFFLAMSTLYLATHSNFFTNRIKTPWISRAVGLAPIVLGICIARQVTKSYLPRVLTPRESEIDSRNKRIEEKIKTKLERKNVNQRGL
uniref:ascorbate ferrireductase (transmembrane) n=1 Tax=Caligus rogercresseyi TaxID=217165 RepID=C1BNG1_CALRO|nr:Cytochrome b561 domain-containing protein 2 [Caligus rogercresseyi]|eukprot:TRINITY_DN8103_c0_g1_i1.p1 TRINITY_DN8103_c0_g1~~TRINITY_DN8103_c0_g1_i1.p1  ORF type:complete len:234 (+),score=51.35 TRINITY_DN8103_c0_g1_i1:129-830(+)